MNFFAILFDSIFGFIRRNPITCLVLVVLAVSFPPLFGFVVGTIVVLLVISILSGLLLWWRLHRVKKQMEEQIRNAAGDGFYGGGDSREREEGDVSVYRTSSAPSKKFNSDIGEYVDFEEEKDN